MTPNVIVLGAGPCGMALTHDLSRAGVPVTLIEADPQLGGLAKTWEWGETRSDLGPHKLYSLDAEVIHKVKNLLPDDQWLVHPKISRIYLNGHFLGYPPSPSDLLRAFGLGRSMLCSLDLLNVRLRNKTSRSSGGFVSTFEEDARSRVGQSLYQLFFRPLAQKIWGDPVTLDQRLSKSRIQVPSIGEVVSRLVKIKRKSGWQADEYFYPRGGLGRLWDRIASLIRQNGGQIVTGDPVSEIQFRDAGTVASIRTVGGREWSFRPGIDWLISTIPLFRLAKMMSSIPPPVQTAIAQLRLNDLLLIFLKSKEDILGENAWIFVPDEKIIFHRISGQRKFDPSLVEDGLHLICCEVMSYSGKDTFHLTEEALMSRCIYDLKRMGCLNDESSIIDRRLIRLPFAYPVLTVGYQETLETVLGYFDQFKNLRTIGRQGSYNYIGTLDAMDIGFGLARLIINNQLDPRAWNTERQRTSFYPILD
jgi:protoporphyrinogen oxidase